MPKLEQSTAGNIRWGSLISFDCYKFEVIPDRVTTYQRFRAGQHVAYMVRQEHCYFAMDALCLPSYCFFSSTFHFILKYLENATLWRRNGNNVFNVCFSLLKYAETPLCRLF